MSRRAIPLLLAVLASPLLADDLAELLGHEKGTRLLILHADDLGMCQAANEAAREAWSRGVLISGSAMVPCPWFGALADWCARQDQERKPDVGLHLTLTSEWRHYRWGPVLPRAEVPGLVDPDGFLWREVADVTRHATAAEVAAEIRAQVARARRSGLEPTHLDSHMGTLFARPDYFQAYLDVATELDVVPMVPKLSGERRKDFERAGVAILADALLLAQEAKGLPLVDHLVTDIEGENFEARKAWFLELLGRLEPGLTQVILHPSADGPELAAITASHRGRGWDYELLLDPEVREAIERSGAVPVTWREIGEVWRKRRKG